MSDIEEVIKLVNKETEREDLSEEIKQYLFCDLRHKLWKMESERATLDHGYMWICPNCGLDAHSDFTRCPRCGYERSRR